jgi:hypothetical protein
MVLADSGARKLQAECTDIGRPVHHGFSNCGRVGGAVLKRGAGVGGGMLLWGREAH